jgi:hypothetical protein
MSAYIVDNNSINYLVNYLEQEHDKYLAYFRYVDENIKTNQDVGQIILDENVRSVNTRYNEESKETFKYSFENYGFFDPRQVISVCKCIEYQSCETSDWEQSKAYRLITRIKDYAIGEIEGMSSFVGSSPEPK